MFKDRTQVDVGLWLLKESDPSGYQIKFDIEGFQLTCDPGPYRLHKEVYLSDETSTEPMFASLQEVGSFLDSVSDSLEALGLDPVIEPDEDNTKRVLVEKLFISWYDKLRTDALRKRETLYSISQVAEEYRQVLDEYYRHPEAQSKLTHVGCTPTIVQELDFFLTGGRDMDKLYPLSVFIDANVLFLLIEECTGLRLDIADLVIPHRQPERSRELYNSWRDLS